MILLDQVRTFLADGIRRAHDISTHVAGEGGGINYSQLVHSLHLQPVIDNFSHRGCTYKMVLCGDVVADIFHSFLLRVQALVFGWKFAISQRFLHQWVVGDFI